MKTVSDMEELKSYIKGKVTISDSDLNVVLKEFREISLRKGSYLIKEGQLVSDYFFVVSGGLRIYLNTNEQQITGWFALENEFFTELSSLKQQSPCRFNIQAIEETTLLAIPSRKMNELYQTYPLWQQFGREVWEDAFLKVVAGILSYQMLTAEERYQLSMEQSNLLQRVPLKDLSSFLGVTPNSLSRIRKNTK